jgi:hypothetical protein
VPPLFNSLLGFFVTFFDINGSSTRSKQQQQQQKQKKKKKQGQEDAAAAAAAAATATAPAAPGYAALNPYYFLFSAALLRPVRATENRFKDRFGSIVLIAETLLLPRRTTDKRTSVQQRRIIMMICVHLMRCCPYTRYVVGLISSSSSSSSSLRYIVIRPTQGYLPVWLGFATTRSDPMEAGLAVGRLAWLTLGPARLKRFLGEQEQLQLFCQDTIRTLLLALPVFIGLS